MGCQTGCTKSHHRRHSSSCSCSAYRCHYNGGKAFHGSELPIHGPWIFISGSTSRSCYGQWPYPHLQRVGKIRIGWLLLIYGVFCMVLLSPIIIFMPIWTHLQRYGAILNNNDQQIAGALAWVFQLKRDLYALDRVSCQTPFCWKWKTIVKVQVPWQLQKHLFRACLKDKVHYLPIFFMLFWIEFYHLMLIHNESLKVMEYIERYFFLKILKILCPTLYMPLLCVLLEDHLMESYSHHLSLFPIAES